MLNEMPAFHPSEHPGGWFYPILIAARVRVLARVILKIASERASGRRGWDTNHNRAAIRKRQRDIRARSRDQHIRNHVRHGQIERFLGLFGGWRVPQIAQNRFFSAALFQSSAA
jgi:hypothetical protein